MRNNVDTVMREVASFRAFSFKVAFRLPLVLYNHFFLSRYHEVTTTCGLKVSDVIDDDTDDDDIDLSSEEDPLPSANMHDRVTLAVNHWFDPAIALRES